MPQRGLIIRALVASPSDCVHERKIIPEVIAAWNAVHSLDRAAVIEPVLWESHSYPELGDRPQAIINKQLVEHCDILIGTFWTRLGTPTGVAASGTAEEIEKFRAAKKPVLLYFSSAPVVPESLDHEQYQALLQYRTELGQHGLYSAYGSLAAFREQLQRHLASAILELLKPESDSLRAGGHESLESEQQHALRQYVNEFQGFVRRLKVDWEAERDSEPFGTDDGKFILSRAADELLHFKSMITEDTSGVSREMADILKKLKGIQRHQTYLDGGKSFNEFWAQGTVLVEEVEGLVPDLKKVLGSTSEAREP